MEDDYEDDWDIDSEYVEEDKTETVKLLDREGVDKIAKALDDMEETTQFTQNMLLLTCMLAQNQGIEYTSFIELVTKNWPLADKIVSK